jgi:hypothetical protein
MLGLLRTRSPACTPAERRRLDALLERVARLPVELTIEGDRGDCPRHRSLADIGSGG